MTYTLLDFGRRSSSAEAARQALAAANFSFDRKMQDVVFAVQRSYYALCAARAAVTAARHNLELAQSDFDAVQQRTNLGLATEPALLLAKERVAQSQYDVANAELLVHDAQASLAAAIGIPANQPMEVASLDALPVPTVLDGQVDELIAAYKAASRSGGESRGAARERGAGRAGQGGLVSDCRPIRKLRPAHLALHVQRTAEHLGESAAIFDAGHAAVGRVHGPAAAQ